MTDAPGSTTGRVKKLILLVGVIAVRAIDRWLYTRVDFEDEIKAGNVAAAIYKSALLLFVAVVIATVMS